MNEPRNIIAKPLQDILDDQYLREQAEQMKYHLTTHAGSVGDVRCYAYTLEQVRRVFTEVLGDKLVERVTFITRLVREGDVT